jgi:hypothetical protein
LKEKKERHKPDRFTASSFFSQGEDQTPQDLLKAFTKPLKKIWPKNKEKRWQMISTNEESPDGMTTTK